MFLFNESTLCVTQEIKVIGGTEIGKVIKDHAERSDFHLDKMGDYALLKFQEFTKDRLHKIVDIVAVPKGHELTDEESKNYYREFLIRAVKSRQLLSFFALPVDTSK